MRKITSDFAHTHTTGKVDGRDARIAALLAGEPTIELARVEELTIRVLHTDTAIITGLLTADHDLPLEEAAMDVLPRLRGAFSLIFCDETTLYAARDPQGVRPLVLGRLERGWVVASETAALDIVRRR